MTYESLRDFIKILEGQGQLLRVQEPVSPFLEMTEVQYRLIRSHGPAVLFEKPVHQNGKLYQYPVLVNLFGTVDRVALGLNQKRDTLRELGKWLAFLQSPDLPEKINDAYRMWPVFKNVLNMRPRTVKKAACQEIIWFKQDIDLFKLPIQTCWPNEPSPLITWPLVVTKGPNAQKDKRDKENLGIYRMQVVSCNKLIVRWLAHRGGARQFAAWKKIKSEPFPIAAIIGADPGTMLAAVSPIPDTLSEYEFAGLLRNKKINLVECMTVPLRVPASAEIIIEGLVSLEETLPEGPFGDHTGYYNSVENFPVVTVTAITMRNNPIYLSTYTGRPPDEPSILGESLNELFIPLLQKQFPEIIDFWLPPEGCSYRMAVVSIHKDYPGHAKRVMMGVWGFLRQFMYIKWIIVIDHDLNPRDWSDVIWAMSTCMDPKRDIIIIEETPIDYLDFSSPVSGLGSKIGLDATSKWPGETNRTWGEKIHMDLHTKQKIDLLWKKLKL